MNKSTRTLIVLLALALMAGLVAAAPVALAEPPQCSDGIDNDNDGRIDYPDDVECGSAQDDSEADVSIGPQMDIWFRYNHKSQLFVGELNSSLPRGCRSQRLVRVKKVRPGRDMVIGSDRTDRDYQWEVPRKRPHGRFYAVAPGMTKQRKDGTTVTCKRLRSFTIRIRSRNAD